LAAFERVFPQDWAPLVLTMKICVIIPMYNEENIAKNSVMTTMSYIKQIPDPVTLAVVNDGSKDKTEIILQQLLGEFDHDQYRLITYPVNRGYGGALKAGIKFAVDNHYDYVVFMDSDLTNHPKYLKDFYEKMLQGYDYIKASRYMKGGGGKGVPFKRVIISRMGNILAKCIMRLPLTDFTNGFRAVKVSLLKQIDLKENSYPLMVEELKKASRLTNNFCEIPNILETRSVAAGKSKFKYNAVTFWKYIKYLFV